MKQNKLLVAAIPPSDDFFGNRSSGSSAMASCWKPTQWIVAAYAHLVAPILPHHDFYGNGNSGNSPIASCSKRVHWIVVAAVVGWLSIVPVVGAEARDGLRADGIAAHVNGESITTGQLEEAIQNEVDQMNQQLEQIKRSMLDHLINNLLLRQAARVEGLDANGFLKVNVESLTVSEDEVDAAYEKSKHRFPAVLESEVKYRIRRKLEDNRRAEALKQLLSKLRRSAKVRNFLLEGSPGDVDLQPQSGPSLGPPQARVTIVEFSDFECPFCRKLQPVLRKVLERWPNEVRRVYKHFPLDRHRHAFGASKASVCADRQGRFWEFHDALYREGQDMSPQGVASVAKALGLELGPFEACLRDESTGSAVQADRSVAARAGVRGTPTLFVNGRRLQAPSQLESEIEALLALQTQRTGE